MTQQDLQFRRDLLGVDHPAGSLHVTEEKILEYCRIVGERNPLYTDPEAARQHGFRSVLAPPTFLQMFIGFDGRPDIQLQFAGMQIDGGRSIEMLAPVQAGETLEFKVRLKDVFTKTGRSGTMAFVVWQTAFINQDGETVALAQEHHILYPGQRESAPARPDVPRRYFEDVELGDEIGPMPLAVPRQTVVDYCRLWGHPMPNRFTDDEVARREGLKAAVVPSSMSMGLMGGLISQWAADAQLKRLDIVLRQPFSLFQPVHMVGIVTDKKEESDVREIHCDLYIESQEGGRLIGGQAVIELPARPS